MADSVGGPDEAARLWRVNRTIHELVKDRVCLFLTTFDSIRSLMTVQGFQVSDEEISMELATFKQQYANSGGSVEYAPLTFIR